MFYPDLQMKAYQCANQANQRCIELKSSNSTYKPQHGTQTCYSKLQSLKIKGESPGNIRLIF